MSETQPLEQLAVQSSINVMQQMNTDKFQSAVSEKVLSRLRGPVASR